MKKNEIEEEIDYYNNNNNNNNEKERIKLCSNDDEMLRCVDLI